MKTVCSLCLFFAWLLSMAGCSPAPETTAPASRPSQTVQSTAKPTETTQNTKVSIEETVLLEEAGVKITAKSISDGLFGAEVKLLIENNSGKDLVVQTRNTAVNGFMVDSILSAQVRSGKKANESLTFVSADLERSGIEKVAQMEFSFHIFTSDNWETYLDSQPVTVNTSIFPTYQQKIDDSGETVYEENGVKIVVRGLTTGVLGPEIEVYMENTGDKAVLVQVRDISVNGFLMEPVFFRQIPPGKRVLDGIVLLEGDLEKNGVEKIEGAELSFVILDGDNWDTLAESQSTTINF